MSKKSTKKSIKSAVKASKRPLKKLSQKSAKPVTKPSKVSKAPKTPKTSKFRSPYPRASANPFREGSSYAVAFDVLAGHPDGITRGQLVLEVSKVTGKDEKHAGYDCAVLLSAKENGERHQSCREGFYLEKINDHLVLKTAPAPAAAK